MVHGGGHHHHHQGNNSSSGGHGHGHGQGDTGGSLGTPETPFLRGGSGGRQHQHRNNHGGESTNFFFFNYNRQRATSSPSSHNNINRGSLWWTDLTPQWNPAAYYRRGSFFSDDDAGSRSTCSDHDRRGYSCWSFDSEHGGDNCYDCAGRRKNNNGHNNENRSSASFCRSICSVLLCVFCCSWCGNRSSSDEGTGRQLQSGSPSRQRTDRGRRNRRNSSSLYPSSIFSLFAFLVLVSMSSVPDGGGEGERQREWTLNAGETMRAKCPVLNNRIDIESSTADGTSSARISVYEFPGRDCPPLTGPPVTLADHFSFRLAAGDFQYDYFHLNAGSTIELNVTQTAGSTNVYVMNGAKMLDRVSGDAVVVDDDEFRVHAKLRRYATAGSSSLGSVGIRYHVPKDDVYILLYDNASTDAGEMTAQYRVTATTHDLRDAPPVCDNVGIVPCSVDQSPVTRRSCLIIRTDSNGGQSGVHDIVTIRMAGHTAWIAIVIISIVPIVLQSLFDFVYYRRRDEYERVEDTDLRYSSTSLPPPIAPTYIKNNHTRTMAPTDPVTSGSVEVSHAVPDYVIDTSGIPVAVPVPVENIVPVPPPSK